MCALVEKKALALAQLLLPIGISCMKTECLDFLAYVNFEFKIFLAKYIPTFKMQYDTATTNTRNLKKTEQNLGPIIEIRHQLLHGCISQHMKWEQLQ